MGYNTEYSMLMDNQRVPKGVQEVFEAKFGFYVDYGEMKWYDWHEDMLEFSKIFPEASKLTEIWTDPTL